jgi:hypothetical protein
MSYQEDVAAIEKELAGVDIPVLKKKRVKQGRIPDRVSVVVASRSRLALAFAGRCVGHIVRTSGQQGKIWKAQEIDQIASQDLHRVCLRLASYHPPFSEQTDTT